MKLLSVTGIMRALVIAPHPDDETIGAFGLLHHLTRHGTKIRIVVVTDGTASHKSASWPNRRLALKRRAESRLAMRKAGIGAGAIRFLNYPDSQLATIAPPDFARLVHRLSDGPEPDLVIRPTLHDFHSDHQCVARASDSAWPPRVRQLTYRVWPEDPPHHFKPLWRLPLTTGLSRMKAAAIRVYKTQTGLIHDDPDGFCMDRELIARFAGPDEVYGEA
ncbi:PIG-L family deacetylase [Hyphomonas oceanitis]|uniref:PIG-L deacetylase family protein n=1 Tax=Hyphomonas oceanitis TaxID=81033 RepID=UPI003002EE34